MYPSLPGVAAPEEATPQPADAQAEHKPTSAVNRLELMQLLLNETEVLSLLDWCPRLTATLL